MQFPHTLYVQQAGRTGGHLGLARDGRQSGAARADLEDALPSRLLLQGVLLPGRDRSLA